jgi:hypothetical protein
MMLRWPQLQPQQRCNSGAASARACPPSQQRRSAGRLSTPRYSLFDVCAESIASTGGVLVAAVAGSLLLVESQSKGRVQKELEEAQASLRAKAAEIAELKQQLGAAQKVGPWGGCKEAARARAGLVCSSAGAQRRACKRRPTSRALSPAARRREPGCARIGSAPAQRQLQQQHAPLWQQTESLQRRGRACGLGHRRNPNPFPYLPSCRSVATRRR